MKNNNNVKAVLLVAPWCDSSYKIKPMFYETCRNLGMRFEVLDVEEKDGLNMSIKYTVRNVPTILFLDNKGREKGRAKGSKAYLDIVNFVK
jgi:thiol-disulfide isomerase/thioredoxin